jgi:hypothetical protein
MVGSSKVRGDFGEILAQRIHLDSKTADQGEEACGEADGSFRVAPQHVLQHPAQVD